MKKPSREKKNEQIQFKYKKHVRIILRICVKFSKTRATNKKIRGIEKVSYLNSQSSLHRFNQKIRKFESTHPHLTLVSFDNFSKTIPVTNEYLFSDTTHRYSELSSI